MAWIRDVTITMPATWTTQTVTGLPGAPVAIIALCAAGRSIATRPSFSYGFCDGSLSQGCTVQRSTVSGGTSDELTTMSNTAIAAVYQGFTYRTMAIASITSDGFTVTASGNLDNITVVSFRVFGGAGVSANVSNFSQTSAANPASKTGLSFTPTLLFGIFSAAGGVTWGNAQNTSHFSTVIFDGTTRRSHYAACLNGAGTTQTRSAARTGNGFGASTNSTALTSDPQITVTSLNAAGYTWSQGSASTMLSVWLALTGVSAKLLTTTVQASTGTVALTGAGFQPNSAMMIVSPLATTNDATLANEGSYAIGWTSSGNYDVHQSVSGDALAAPTDADAQRSTAGFVRAIKRTGANTFANRFDATLQSYDADGLTLNWTAADATAGLVTILAFNDGGTPVGLRSWFLSG